jgi:Uncharacterized protein conserved in bacteria
MIKSFLDAEEERIEPKTTSADSSIFGGLDSASPSATPEHHDPFAASDFHIEYSTAVPTPGEKTVTHEPFAYTPPTAAESSRMSGLAFTAGIAFVSSVAFMLVLGWLVDTFIGTGPWGIVGGIVLGSIIGFIQFFRLNSQILNNSKNSQTTSFLDLGEKAQEIEVVQADPASTEPENNPTAL